MSERERVRPSVSGRLVEIREALRALDEELRAAAKVERDASVTAAGGGAEAGDTEAPWRQLEQAACALGACRKDMLDVESLIAAARLRGWGG